MDSLHLCMDGYPNPCLWWAGLPQARFFVFKDMPFFIIACYCQKLTTFVNTFSIFANIFEYVSMYGTAYVPNYNTYIMCTYIYT